MLARTTLRRLAIASLAVFSLSGCSSESPEYQALTDQPERKKKEPTFKPQVVIANSFPAIVRPPTVSAAEANKTVHAEELVLGVEINGFSRAYPINMLTGPQREIINDRIGDRAIAATW